MSGEFERVLKSLTKWVKVDHCDAECEVYHEREITALTEAHNADIAAAYKLKGIACDKHDLVHGWACPQCASEKDKRIEELEDALKDESTYSLECLESNRRMKKEGYYKAPFHHENPEMLADAHADMRFKWKKAEARIKELEEQLQAVNEDYNDLQKQVQKVVVPIKNGRARAFYECECGRRVEEFFKACHCGAHLNWEGK